MGGGRVASAGDEDDVQPVPIGATSAHPLCSSGGEEVTHARRRSLVRPCALVFRTPLTTVGRTATRGFDHLYIETHDWRRALAFWQALGFELQSATDHGSGMLTHPAGGPSVFLAEQPLDDPPASEVYLTAGPDFVAPDGIEVVSPFRATHWGTKVLIIQDPDGHQFRLEAPAGDDAG